MYDIYNNIHKLSNLLGIKPDVEPEDTIQWKQFDVLLTDAETGEIVFKQDNVTFPEWYSQQSVDIITSKYFYGKKGTSERESDFRQVVKRITDTIVSWVKQDNPTISSLNLDKISKCMRTLLYDQYFAYNSPVWFNLGTPHAQQGSACFIDEINDNMESIAQSNDTWYQVFRGASGIGANRSRMRSSHEYISGGGKSSGPCSFAKVSDAIGKVTKSGGKSRRAAIMELLDAEHGDIRKFIHQKREEERKAKALIAAGWSADFDDPDGAYGSVFFQNSNQSVRLSNAFMVNLQEKFPWYTLEVRPTEGVAIVDDEPKGRQTHQGTVFTGEDGEQYIRKDGKLYKVIEKLDTQALMDEIAQCAWETADPGVQFSDTINWWHTCPGDGKIEGSNPCSEYFFLNNTACNLASMNLMKFLREDNTFNTELFTAVVGLLVLTMDAIVSGADYPTQTIAKATRRYRTLGIGYTNLGAMLMVMGLPYDSNIARLVAGEITARMTLSAYAFSNSLANIIGEAECFSPGNDENREAIKKVVGMHVSEYEDNVYNNVEYYGHLFDEDSYSLTQHILNIQQYGFPCRNAQVTVLAPTGTISFIMGCDTTGIEPAFSLVSYKKLVGGNVMKLVTDCVHESLRRLSKSDDFRGYDVEEIIKEFMETGKLTKVPAKYLPIFRTAVGDDAISYEAHLLMMQATQRFLSGGISKTVNMPANSTVEDVKNVYLKAWNMGIKSVALYRNGCKASQPMNTSLDKKEDSSAQAFTHARRKLPAVVKSDRYKFEIGGAIDGYIHIGLFEDGQPGEIFIRTSKQGSTLNGLFDAWATMVSMSLQYGVPLDVIVEKHKNSKFEPAGLTNYKNKEMRFATSVLDFVAKLLQFYYMDGREDAVTTPAIPEPADMKVEKVNGEVCSNCGGTLQNAGSCHVCTSCGETTGCG